MPSQPAFKLRRRCPPNREANPAALRLNVDFLVDVNQFSVAIKEHLCLWEDEKVYSILNRPPLARAMSSPVILVGSFGGQR